MANGAGSGRVGPLDGLETMLYGVWLSLEDSVAMRRGVGVER